VPRHLSVVAGLGLHYAHAPLVRANADGTMTPVVGGLAQADAFFAIGLFERVELGVAMPLALGDVASDPLANDVMRAWRIAPGDLRLSAKVPILRGAFALAARGVFTLPTGDANDLFGAPYWTATPSLGARRWARSSTTTRCSSGSARSGRSARSSRSSRSRSSASASAVARWARASRRWRRTLACAGAAVR
jgi:hypothetical protein